MDRLGALLVVAVALGGCGSEEPQPEPQPEATETEGGESEGGEAEGGEAAAGESEAPPAERVGPQHTAEESKQLARNRGREGTLELNAIRRTQAGREGHRKLKQAMAASQPGSLELQRLGGTWRLEGETNRYWSFWTQGGALHGVLLNPPFETMRCEFIGTLAGTSLTGSVHWTEGEHTMETAWELELVSFDKLTGRVEAADWEDGQVYSREWVDGTTLVKVSDKR